jgi:hypothetical protein
VVTAPALFSEGEKDIDHRLEACATKKPQKLPGWLKNASPAVRRDYLKGIGG